MLVPSCVLIAKMFTLSKDESREEPPVLTQVSWRRLTGDRHLRDVKEERKECHTIGRDKIKCELHLPATRRTVQEKVTSTFHVTESYSRAILGN